MYNLHTVCKSAHVNGALFLSVCLTAHFHRLECREQWDTNREKQWFGSHLSFIPVHSSHIWTPYYALFPVRETNTNVLNCLKPSCLSPERGRMQNNVTRARGMDKNSKGTRNKCDPSHWLSLFVSHCSLHSWQWRRVMTQIQNNARKTRCE